jgi:hypothetical protein
MRLRPKKVALTVVWLLLLSLWTVSLWSAVAQAAGSGGSLQIRIEAEDGAQYPPGDLVLSDPNARMTGSDSRANNNYQEIPGATYSGETISSQQHAIRLYVDNAVSGTYSLRVIGVDSGRYILSMKGYDEDGNHADLRFTGGLEPGEVHHYVIHYSNQGGASLRARRTSAAE